MPPSSSSSVAAPGGGNGIGIRAANNSSSRRRRPRSSTTTTTATMTSATAAVPAGAAMSSVRSTVPAATAPSPAGRIRRSSAGGGGGGGIARRPSSSSSSRPRRRGVRGGVGAPAATEEEKEKVEIDILLSKRIPAPVCCESPPPPRRQQTSAAPSTPPALPSSERSSSYPPPSPKPAEGGAAGSDAPPSPVADRAEADEASPNGGADPPDPMKQEPNGAGAVSDGPEGAPAEAGAGTSQALAAPTPPQPQAAPPPRPRPQASQHHHPMTVEEELRAAADVFGRSPPEIELRESRLSALEREIARLPRPDRRALGRALRHHPLLTVAGPHARGLLRDDDFDPAEAARRLAKYWERREAMFGRRAYDEGVFTDPTFDDYLRFYDKCRRVAERDEEEEDGDDEDGEGAEGGEDRLAADVDMRDIAAEYVRCVHRAKINALDRLLEESPARDRAAYDEALEKRSSHVRPPEGSGEATDESDGDGATAGGADAALAFADAGSDEHKLMFLRSEDMVETKAAVRLMKYWAAKKLLFGPDMLGEEVRLDDVQNGVFDVDCEGFFRLMPGTDESGRSVLLVFVNELEKDGWTKEGLAQYLWCVTHIALSRHDTLEQGLIFMVDYRAGTRELYDRISPLRELFRTLLFECVPVKVRVTHWFFDPAAVGWWRGLMLSVFSNVSAVVKKRTVVHMGDGEENRRVLRERFGIGPDQVPAELGGNAEMDDWRRWIRERKEMGL